MVRIEARRNVVVLLLPILAAIAWLQARNGLQTPVVVWPQVTVQARDWVVYLGPFVAAAAVWMGARERRHGMEDLLATTPHPAWRRRGATWTATTLWGLLAYVAVAAGILAYGAARATWGTPLAWPFCWPLLIGLLALPAHAALGFALGRYAPSRFTPPLVAIALLLVQGYVGGAIGEGARVPAWLPYWAAYLSPAVYVDQSVWFGVTPNLCGPQALYLLGLTALALGGLAGGDGRCLPRWGAPLAGAALLVAGVILISRTAPTVKAGNPVMKSAVEARGVQLIPYAPLCGGAPVVVCVHPAYSARLHDAAALVNRVVAPVYGLPGVPTRAVQRSSGHDAPADALVFYPITGAMGDEGAAAVVAVQLAWGRVARYDVTIDGQSSVHITGDGARTMLWLWLMRQAGYNVPPPAQGFGNEVVATEQRFAALPTATQRAWLRAHYAALREGRVPLWSIP
jgi:hypothetical protein